MLRPTLALQAKASKKKPDRTLDIPKLLQSEGRWLFNDQKQLALRELKFDVEALAKVVRKASGGNRIVGFEALREGRYNKVFTFILGGRKEIIARVPYRHAGPRELCTKSEVATMDFLRCHFGSLIPKVLAWEAKPNNPVGCEYILMERVPGQTIGDLAAQRVGVSSQSILDLVKFQADLASLRFSSYGSIFYKEDVAPHLQERPLYAPSMPQDACSERFRIGPRVDRTFYRGERRLMKLDRGPWTNVQDYIKAHANNEIQWINDFSTSPWSQKQLGARVPVSSHIKRLQQWIDLAPHFLPSPELCAPTLSHPDFHLGNILVDKSLSSVLDWQGASIRPFYQTEPPDLGRTFVNDIGHDGRYSAALYLEAVVTRYPALQSLRTDPIQLFSALTNMASCCWEDGLTPLEANLNQLLGSVRQSSAIKRLWAFPFTNSEWNTHQEQKEFIDQEQKLFLLVHQKLDEKGIYMDMTGGVAAGQYEQALKEVERIRQLIAQEPHWKAKPDYFKEIWPLRDGRHVDGIETCTIR